MDSRRLIIDVIEALIPLGIALLLLTFPEWFTKKNLQADGNKGLAGRLRMAGWLLLAAGVLILIANVGSTLARR